MERYPFDPTNIRIERRDEGNDTLLIITGGKAHIGAVSTAYPEGGEYRVSTTVVPGHKEHILSEPAALHASRSLNCTVTVVMGIHYDGITREQIEQTAAAVSRLIDEALEASEKSF